MSYATAGELSLTLCVVCSTHECDLKAESELVSRRKAPKSLTTIRVWQCFTNNKRPLRLSERPFKLLSPGLFDRSVHAISSKIACGLSVQTNACTVNSLGAFKGAFQGD